MSGVVLRYLFDDTSTNLQTVLVFAAVLLAVKWLLRAPENLPPGPRGWPFIGSSGLLKDKPCLKVFEAMAQQYGKMFSLYLGPSLVLVLNDAVSIHQALVKQADSFSGRKIPGAVQQALPSKGSVLFDTGHSWQAIRRFAMGAMRDFGVGKTSISLRINEEARVLCHSFEQHEGKPFDPLPLVTSAISNTICQMSFGHRYDYDDETFVRMKETLRRRTSYTRTALVNYIPWLYYTPLYKELREIEKERRRDIQAVVYEHLSTFDPSHIRDITDLFFNEVRSESKFPFEDMDVERLLHDLFGAGTDTSTNMIMWLLVTMTQHPDVQKKIHDELDQVVGCGRQPAWADRSNLPYSEAVMLEMHRYRPTGALAVPHAVTDDTTLLGYFVPKGTMVLVNLYAAHHDPDYWEEPGVFRPERFLSADGKKVVKPTHNSYLPYGVGRRNCAGEQLAKMEFFLIMASLLQRFNFTIPEEDPVPDMEGKMRYTLSPNPFRICAAPRHS